jgi:N-methylhydantoinase B
MPVVVRRYELLKDSGGVGRNRGGLGLRRDIEIRGHNVEVTSYTMRQVIAPPGVHGGSPASKARFIHNPGRDGEKQMPVVFTNYPVAYGDLLSCETPGGGGLGDPAERPQSLVDRDVREGRMSKPPARQKAA